MSNSTAANSAVSSSSDSTRDIIGLGGLVWTVVGGGDGEAGAGAGEAEVGAGVSGQVVDRLWLAVPVVVDRVDQVVDLVLHGVDHVVGVVLDRVDQVVRVVLPGLPVY